MLEEMQFFILGQKVFGYLHNLIWGNSHGIAPCVTEATYINLTFMLSCSIRLVWRMQTEEGATCRNNDQDLLLMLSSSMELIVSSICWKHNIEFLYWRGKCNWPREPVDSHASRACIVDSPLSFFTDSDSVVIFDWK